MSSEYEKLKQAFEKLRTQQLELRDVLVHLLEDTTNSFKIKTSETKLYDQIVLQDADSPEQLQQDFMLSEKSYNLVVEKLKSRYPEEFESIKLFKSSPEVGVNEEMQAQISGRVSWHEFLMINTTINMLVEQEKVAGIEEGGGREV